MSAADPSSPFNLEYLKKEAKRLLRRCRAGDRDAIAVMQAVLGQLRALPPEAIAARIQLADVHQALAVQCGLASWAELLRFGDPLTRLFAAIRGGHHRLLLRGLRDFSALAAISPHAAAALGNRGALARHIERDAAVVSAPDRGWTPLLYACASPLARLSMRHATSLVACAELLLDAGADVNTVVRDDRDQSSGEQKSAILLAMMSGNARLGWLLHQRGAPQPHQALQQWLAGRLTPDDAAHHRFFAEYFRRPEVRARAKQAQEDLKGNHSMAIGLGFDVGAIRQIPNLIAARTDLWRAYLEQRPDDLTDDQRASALHGLVQYAPPAMIEFFLSRGRDLTRRDADGRSVIATAIRGGNLDAAEVLRAHGAIDDTTPMDRLIGACLAGATEMARALVTADPDLPAKATPEDIDVFTKAGARGDAAQVQMMLNMGFWADALDRAGATALHHAAGRGQNDVVHLLIEAGATVTLEDALYGETPRFWALHGAVHGEGDRDRCLEVAALLERVEADLTRL